MVLENLTLRTWFNPILTEEEEEEGEGGRGGEGEEEENGDDHFEAWDCKLFRAAFTFLSRC